MTAATDRGAVTTVATAIEGYVEDRLARGEINNVTRGHLRSRLASLAASFGADRPVGELDRAGILEWQRTIGQHSPATRRSYLSTVKVFCQWAAAEGLLGVDPTLRLARVREPRRVPRALAGDSVAAILEECAGDVRDIAIVWLMVGCGLRCVEVARLEVGDVDERALTLFVRGKADHERVLPLPAEVARAVDAYLDVRGRRPGPLFVSPRRPALDPWVTQIEGWLVDEPGLSARAVWRRLGDRGAKVAESTVRNFIADYRRGFGADRAMSAHELSRYLPTLMAAAGVKRAPGDGVSAHVLRHTAASDVLDRCHDVRTVQAMPWPAERTAAAPHQRPSWTCRSSPPGWRN